MFPYLEYLSSNKLIKFPFAETAELPSSIPNDLLTDALVVTEDPTQTFYLNKINYTIGEIQLFINNNQLTIDRASNNPYAFFDGMDKIKILVGRFTLDLAYGEYSFTESQTKLESCCIIPYSRIVKTVNTLNNDVILAGGYNTALVNTGQQINIDFAPGNGIGPAPCNHDGYEYGFISKVNTEEVENNLQVKGLDCIQIIHYPESNMIAIHDRCKPCCQNCGDKLTEITGLVEIVQDSIDLLDTRITDLGG